MAEDLRVTGKSGKSEVGTATVLGLVEITGRVISTCSSRFSAFPTQLRKGKA